MKRLPIPLRMLFALLVVVLLAACVPEEQQQPPSAEEIQSAVETSVAQTVEAQEEMAASVAATVEAREAEEAAAEPLPTATAVPPTAMPTLTPVLPTATPIVVTNGGSSGGTSGGGGGTSQYPYSCDIIRQRPRDNTEFKRTHTFDVTFAILNNGTSTWEAGKDLTLLNDHGVLVTPFTTLQLPEMKPGDVFVLPVYDAMAPDEPGHYVIDFKLEGGFCYPYVAFNVVR